MERKMNFVAIQLDGKEKSVENWEKGDVLRLLDLLKGKRADLYEVLESHFTESAGIVCSKIDMCCEPSVDKSYRMAHSKQVVSFNSKLNGAQIEMLVDLVNELHVFSKPKEVTIEDLSAFFNCEATRLKVQNLRLFCALMTALANHEFIGQYWQAPIYRGHLLLSPQKNGYVNRCDLAFANHAINNVIMDSRIERINHVVRNLKASYSK